MSHTPQPERKLQATQPPFKPHHPQQAHRVWLAGLLALGFVHWAQPASLRPATLAAFQQYVHATESQKSADLNSGYFLTIDRLPTAERQDAYAQLGRGEIYIAPVQTLEQGHPISVPAGMVHHWSGTIFIPGATFPEIAGLVQDYDNEENIYHPEVQKSKLLGQDGGTSKVYLQFYYKSLSTAVLNAFFDNQFRRLSDTRGEVDSNSTRINEVRNASRPDQTVLPDGQGSGFLWRLNSYTRMEQKDGGVYLEIETIGLSRTVPPLVDPLVDPLVRSIPRKVLTDLLNDTRVAATVEAQNRTAVKSSPVGLSAANSSDPIDVPALTAGQVFLSRSAARRN